MKKKLLSFIALVLLVLGAYWFEGGNLLSKTTGVNPPSSSQVTLQFPSGRYPETAEHIKEAIQAGKSSICTIDREGAEQNRKHSLAGVPTRKGYDRDEWPMAMCAEGGKGANVKYIAPKDNRGAGSWVSHQLDEFEDGTRVKFVVK
ncbi:Sporulation-specific extracellular nuclease [Paenibacillus polymyxa E681]|uniref:NucA/NucB deoxyribonuclease domain-containing protein n=1 Tax=Paenibacillus polymyxa TaxID=1406 RepID=UPI0001E31C27|nr:NucA/NucB deoxyribonuclease domain-containing protein [Paenibacillus polymyxa]ADM70819.1 DNA-entry nuclease [Paenibacillus polymyxa E681]QNV57842.1 Sporulation-specific extracellular nuclease [Paenibacillus polymyxa E681]QNV62679.1 Sporulation-specific extracellular nuclease [Paenibacillus polymyxa E681]